MNQACPTAVVSLSKISLFFEVVLVKLEAFKCVFVIYYVLMKLRCSKNIVKFAFVFFTFSVLNRVLEPTILMEMKLDDGKTETFEVTHHFSFKKNVLLY